jgi:diguanylate cyclase (GGDEF)-like protein
LKLKETVSELDKLSRYDDLTDLENRRAFEMHINDLWHIFRHKESCITILIVDIDNFKNYNDYYGHLAGDKVLISVASILSKVIDEFNGYISRWGGEEFICLLPFTDSSNGKIIADKLVQSVSSAKIPHIKTPLKEKIITVSIGGASTNISENINPSDIINAADKSMYEAKNSGKNRSGNFNIFSRTEDNQAI